MPKEPPRPGQAKLIHITEQSGDRQEFALSVKNYNPIAIQAAVLMLENRGDPSTAHFYLSAHPTEGFLVFQNNHSPLSVNTVDIEDSDTILLTTRLMPALELAPAEAVEAVADLEQCAAIAYVLRAGKLFIDEDRSKGADIVDRFYRLKPRNSEGEKAPLKSERL